MYCKKCGERIEEGELFCSNCGTKVEQVQEAQKVWDVSKKKSGKKIGIPIPVVCFLLTIAVVVVGVGIYITNTPEYALKEIVEDVKESGIDGLYPHLTGNAKETIDTVSSITENYWVGLIMGYFSEDEDVGALISEIEKIQWGLDEVIKNKDSATVILSFNYEDELTGTVELSMIREEGEWKIDDLELPEFDEINW